MTTVNGRPIHGFEIVEIIEIASAPGHRHYVGGERDDFFRNRDLVHAFGVETERTSQELAGAFHVQRPDWSEHFTGLRCGETIQWAIEHGIVERIGAKPTPRWRLLHRELQFELVGPEKRQRAIRVRGLSGEAAVVAAKLWAREQKRREKARLKRLERHRSSIADWLKGIVRRAPETPLGGPLKRFIVGEHRTIGAVHQFIIDSVDDMDLGEAWQVDTHLGKIWSQLPRPVTPPPPPAADLAILGDLQL